MTQIYPHDFTKTHKNLPLTSPGKRSCKSRLVLGLTIYSDYIIYGDLSGKILRQFF